MFFFQWLFWIVWKLEISTCLDSLKKATFVVWPIVPRMIFRETFCWSISWPFEPLQETRCSFRTFAFSEDGSTHNGRQQDESFMVIITWYNMQMGGLPMVLPMIYPCFTHGLFIFTQCPSLSMLELFFLVPRCKFPKRWYNLANALHTISVTT